MLTIRRYRLKHVPTPFSGVSWKIKMRGTSILLVLSEIWMVFWERRERGFVANLKLPLRFAKYLACTALFLGAFGRGAFVVLMLFTWFRRVDDVIDGDEPLPEGWSEKRYREQKDKLFSSLERGGIGRELLNEDCLLVDAIALTSSLHTSVSEEVTDIWKVIQWECARRELRRLASRSELVRETARLDRAILRVCVKMLRGDVDKFDGIARAFTGVFTRADWLDDILMDLHEQIVNIPAEAISVYGIDMERVLACKSWEDLAQYPPFIAWYRAEVQQSTREWQDVRARLGRDFGGVFKSWIISRLAARMTVHKLQSQFNRAASRAL